MHPTELFQRLLGNPRRGVFLHYISSSDPFPRVYSRILSGYSLYLKFCVGC
jgi:hypothetical protein